MRASTYGVRCSDSNLSLSACACVCFSSAMFALFSFSAFAAAVVLSEMESDQYLMEEIIRRSFIGILIDYIII